MARCRADPRAALVEDGGHQAHVLDHGDRVAVADRHAGRLLAPVLQREEAVEGEVGHLPAGGVDTEDTAGFLHGVAHCRTGRTRHESPPNTRARFPSWASRKRRQREIRARSPSADRGRRPARPEDEQPPTTEARRPGRHSSSGIGAWPPRNATGNSVKARRGSLERHGTARAGGHRHLGQGHGQAAGRDVVHGAEHRGRRGHPATMVGRPARPRRRTRAA